MAQNNERKIRVAVEIKEKDGYECGASMYCTEEEFKNFSTKDFLDRIVAPIAAFARRQFFKQSEKRAKIRGF